MSQGTTKGVPIDVDGTLAANSDQLVASQRATKTYADTKQSALVSGTNIKTVNTNSLLGAGDVSVGDMLGSNNLSDVVDANASLNALLPTQTSSSGKVLTTNATNASWTDIGVPVYARVTGSNATTSSTTLVDITGLSIALAANCVYEIEVCLLTGTSAVTTGMKYGINYSAAGAAVFAGYNGTTTDTSNVTNRMTALNTGTSTFMTTSASTNGSFLLKGIVTTGANTGNVTAQHLKVTSGTSTVFIGSYMKITRIS